MPMEMEDLKKTATRDGGFLTNTSIYKFEMNEISVYND